MEMSEYSGQIAKAIRNMHKPFVFGGFEMVRQDQVLEAVNRGRVVAIGHPPYAVAMFSQLGTASTHKTFDDREIQFGLGDIYVSHFGCSETKSGVKAIEWILKMWPIDGKQPGRLVATKRRIFVEIFEEDARSKAVLERFDFQYLGTQIASGSEIKGIYCHPARQDDYKYPKEQQTSLAAIDYDFISRKDLRAIKQEVAAYEKLFGVVPSNYNKGDAWEAFCLRGYSDDPEFLDKSDEIKKETNPDKLKAALQDTRIAHMFPITSKYVNRIPGLKERVRFTRLRKDDGVIGRHSDRYYKNLGLSDDKLVRFHVPIITDADNVTFYSWDARGKKLRKTFDEGTLFYLDIRKPHEVVNLSEIDRIHLVVDCFSCKETRKLIGSCV
jgi:hypothetical protein